MFFSSLRTGALRKGASSSSVPAFKATTMHTTARSGAQGSASGAASQVASQATSAAQSASKQLSNLAERAQALGKPLADRATQYTGVNVGAYAESLGYHFRVAGAIAKRVYIAEGLAPPSSLQTVTDAFRTMYARAIDPSYWTRIYNNGDWKQLAVYAVEAYGIFTIGEMIGRRHIVGYKINKAPLPEGAGGHH